MALPVRTDVVIVGAGPCGLMTANLLGMKGIDTLLIEKGEDLLNLPRAVSIDDESMRVIHAAGLEEEAAKIVLPGTGTKYFGRREDVLLGYARGPKSWPYGYPPKNPIDQPEFDRMLLSGLERFASVSAHFGTELIDVEAGDQGVRVDLRGADSERHSVEAKYLLGCDGGRSKVRELLGIEMLGDTWPEEWIVIDTINDHHRERYAMHFGNPDRPYVIVPGREGRCRYEFRLAPGEMISEPIPIEFIRSLLVNHRPRIEAREIVRATVYQFHALIAETWRVGNVLLMGDAAHMMPPFAGQGLNSAIRDAHNLAWKLAGVVSGQMRSEVLDTYEQERRPHAEAMIDLSSRLGGLVMTRSKPWAALRDYLWGAFSRLPTARRYVSEMRFKPAPRLPRAVVESLGSEVSDLTGAMLPQAAVLREDLSRVLLDEVLGDGFSVVLVGGEGKPSVGRHGLWRRLGARLVKLDIGDLSPDRGQRGYICVADADGHYEEALASVEGRAMLVRPDRYVAGVFSSESEERFAQTLIEAYVNLPAVDSQPTSSAPL